MDEFEEFYVFRRKIIIFFYSFSHRREESSNVSPTIENVLPREPLEMIHRFKAHICGM